MGFLGLIGTMFAGVAAMLTLLPFVLEHYYGESALLTGVLMGTIPMCGMAGGALSMYLSKRVEPFALVRVGMLPYAGAALLAACVVARRFPFWGSLLPFRFWSPCSLTSSERAPAAAAPGVALPAARPASNDHRRNRRARALFSSPRRLRARRAGT